MSLVKVASFSSRVEAEMAGAMLRSNGIQYGIRGDDVGIFGPGHMGRSGIGIDLLVPEEAREEAREILADAGLLEEDGEG